MNDTHKGITTLLRAGITGESLSLPDGCSLEKIAALAKKQSVTPLVLRGAQNCGLDQDHPVIQKMQMDYYRHLMVHVNQMQAVQKIFDTFEEAGISYMPVKGCILKALYPQPELRPMGDADILIRAGDHNLIRPIMDKLGFTHKIENDHVFEWNSAQLHVELHKSLVPPTDEDYFSYYETGWNLARKGSGCRHDLSAEDGYIFLVIHFARHYRFGGIGCRHVADLFIYRRAYPELNTQYIDGELKKLHLAQFHENLMQLLNVWFLDADSDKIIELMTAFIFSGGSWGTMESNMYAQEIRAAARLGGVSNSGAKSVLRALFPPISQLTYRYEIVRKCPALLPLIWVVRWIDIVFFRPQKIRRRVQILRSIDDSKVMDRRNALEAVGLEYY